MWKDSVCLNSSAAAPVAETNLKKFSTEEEKDFSGFLSRCFFVLGAVHILLKMWIVRTIDLNVKQSHITCKLDKSISTILSCQKVFVENCSIKVTKATVAFLAVAVSV